MHRERELRGRHGLQPDSEPLRRVVHQRRAVHNECSLLRYVGDGLRPVPVEHQLRGARERERLRPEHVQVRRMPDERRLRQSDLRHDDSYVQLRGGR